MNKFVLFYPSVYITFAKTKIRRNRFVLLKSYSAFNKQSYPDENLEFTFRTVPCTEIVNDVLSGSWVKLALKVLLSRPTVSLPIYRKNCITNLSSKKHLPTFPLPDTQKEYNYVKPKTKTGTKNGQRTSSSPSLSETAVSFTALFTTMFPRQNMTSSSIRKWHSARTPRDDQPHHRRTAG